MKKALLNMAVLLAPAAALAGGFRAAPVAAYKDGAVSYGFSAGFTALEGKAREHVFSPKEAAAEYAAEFGAPYSDRRHQMSRLDWDMTSVSLFGLTGSARYERLSLNLGGWYGGSADDEADMKDYDWFNGDHVSYTEFSHSETELTDAWMFDANASVDFWRGESVIGYLFAGARAQRWKWTCDGRNDYLYSENLHVWAHDEAHVCDYRQVYFFGYLGVGGSVGLSDHFGLSAYALWAPAYKGRDRDNHIAAEKDFHSHFDYDDGNVYSAGVSLDWKFEENASVVFAVDAQKATLHEGDVSVYEYGTGETDYGDDSAGFESKYVTFSVSLNYAF